MPMSFVFLVALRSTEERIVSVTQEKRVSPPQGFSLIIQFEGVESTQWIAGYEGDDEGIFSVKYLPSRFDKIGVPQMNTGIYKDHALLVTNLEKGRTTMRVPSVKQDLPKNGTCGGMQRFLREGQPRWCVEESKSRSLNLHIKKRFMGRGLMVLERR